jgi:hypothetical protein
MIAANIRLLALQEKAKYFPADLTNAKNRAKDYSNYVERMIPRVETSIAARFGPVKFCPMPVLGTLLIGDGCYGPGYCCTQDGREPPFGAQTEEAAKSARDTSIKQLQESPVSSMKENMNKWRDFANG